MGVSALLAHLLSRSNPVEWLLGSAALAIYIWGIWCGTRLLEARGAQRALRRQRADIAFGLDGGPWNEDMVLQRYELLYEAGLPADVAAHLGIDFLPGMVDPRSNRAGVATASLVQVRQPVTARKVAKWEPYRDYLQPLIRGLGDPTRP